MRKTGSKRDDKGKQDTKALKRDTKQLMEDLGKEVPELQIQDVYLEGHKNILQSKFKELDSLPQFAKAVDMRKKGGFIRKMYSRMRPELDILIMMELRTGAYRLFMVNEKQGTFEFCGGTYVMDPELKVWVRDCGCYMLRYHQDFVLPIKQQIPIGEINKAIRAVGNIEVENATNPSTFKEVLVSKIAEQVLKGQSFAEFLKGIKMSTIVTLIIVALHFLAFMWKSGMLQQVKIPGVM